MKILYLSSRFPYPPHRGDRLTGFQFVRQFSQRHEVTLLSFRDGREPPEAEREIGKLCQRVESVRLSSARSWTQAWLGLTSRVPSQVSYYRSQKMFERVAALTASTRFDAVFVHLFRMAPFACGIQGSIKVLFLGDSLALSLDRSMKFQPLWKRPGVAWERRRVADYECRVSGEFRENWVLSEIDRQHLVARGCQNVVVLPHGVDERLFELPIGPRAAPHVLFLGNLSVPHNVDAAIYLAREIWPIIHAEVPASTLDLVGADAVRTVRTLSSLPGVSVVGAVPDLAPWWRRAAVLVAPLRFSSGIQNKVLEAMAAGVPVVTTPQVAAGIGALDDEVLRVAPNAEGIARATVELLRGETMGTAVAQRARAFVRSRFGWEQTTRRLEGLVEDVGRPAVHVTR